MATRRPTLFDVLSRRSRERKVGLLRELFALSPSIRILDVGGELDHANAQLIETHPDRRSITVVNLRDEHLDRIRSRYPDVRTRAADARSLPFEDQSFDLVYSNAVIEHVGGLEDQAAMAREVMRVGRNWFVTTPNRWFPFEFHVRLPFVSWLPAAQLIEVARWCAYDHGRRRYRSGIQQQLRLLTQSELHGLFPSSRIVPVRITIWPETLVAAGGQDLIP